MPTNVVLPFPSGTIHKFRFTPANTSATKPNCHGSGSRRSPSSNTNSDAYCRKCSTVKGSSDT
jgi:hypothetical protein